MRAERSDADYMVYLSPEDLRRAASHEIGLFTFEHPTLFCTINGTPPRPNKEMLAFCCTNAHDIVFHPEAHDRILVVWDETGATVYTFTNDIIDLLEGERKQLVTRYDGHTNKVWVIREDEPLHTVRKEMVEVRP